MPAFTPIQGELLIGLFTVFWGVYVESWYVSRSTIWFNVVPVLVMMMTLDLASNTITMLWIFVIISIVSVYATQSHGVKQLVGAKGYGLLVIVMGLSAIGIIQQGTEWFWWLVGCVPVFLLWFGIRQLKQIRSDDW